MTHLGDPAFRFPGDWHDALADQLDRPHWAKLAAFIDEQRATHEVYPPAREVFAALEHTPLAEVRVLLLGQDPYHGAGQAHGLCFSVRPDVPIPPSLRNVYRELHEDLGVDVPDHGDLHAWARQGVLLLNAVLTVRAGEPNSHKGRGWETLTDRIIDVVNAKPESVVFVLWGGYARKKARRIDTTRHGLVEGAHPSPLSVKKFRGSRPFSQVNAKLAAAGRPPIDWAIPPR